MWDGDVRLKSERGQATVEFALVLPILLLLIGGIINFGWVFGNQLLTQNAAREAARYAAIHYYDSSVDDDRAVAADIVVARAPTINSPVVTLTVVGETVTVKVSSSVNFLTPLISELFPDGKCTITTQCVMRLE